MTQSDVEQLARDYYDRLFRAALFMCNDPEVAEDLVQDTFVAAIKAIDRFEGRSSHYTWLYGIFLNKFRSWLRKNKREKSFSLQHRAEQFDLPNEGELLESDMPGTLDIMLQRERAETVRKAIGKLPPHHREALALRYIEGMSYEKISGVLDCSIGTVKSRIHYALKKVAERLRKEPAVRNDENQEI